jgi:ribosomal-protein-alanine N-acetyltransferase
MHLAPNSSIAALGPSDRHELASFFAILACDADTARFFRPHPLTEVYANLLCAGVARRRDRYFLARREGQVVGYSMLRGWDDGYVVPSFGVGIRPEARGSGLGHLLFEHAVSECLRAGAPAMRLTVYKANERAVHIYRKSGMTFQEKNADEWIGVLDLRDPSNADAMPAAHAASERRPSTDAR